ncbi:MAG: 2-amino-4-hydroxy-6-hydroxymethyldihydropteridine diphosphokinase [Chitinivibrionia bacterium]|nr:2-amino-4-hydroxy-6-hydroxymethyldihydropteridine diphosphokinase [Chitinivibrionia bacterium]
MKTGFLSIGSNVGEREANVLRAVRMLDCSAGIRVVAHSSLYETAPFECPEQRHFINMAAEVRTLLSPPDLLKQVQAIEARMGRTGTRNEPRPIDIDIVSLGDAQITSDGLIIPHPRYHARAFVLVPLLEIAPEYRCPIRGRFGAELFREIGDSRGVELVSLRTCACRQQHLHHRRRRKYRRREDVAGPDAREETGRPSRRGARGR